MRLKQSVIQDILPLNHTNQVSISHMMRCTRRVIQMPHRLQQPKDFWIDTDDDIEEADCDSYLASQSNLFDYIFNF